MVGEPLVLDWFEEVRSDKCGRFAGEGESWYGMVKIKLVTARDSNHC